MREEVKQNGVFNSGTGRFGMTVRISYFWIALVIIYYGPFISTPFLSIALATCIFMRRDAGKGIPVPSIAGVTVSDVNRIDKHMSRLELLGISPPLVSIRAYELRTGSDGSSSDGAKNFVTFEKNRTRTRELLGGLRTHQYEPPHETRLLYMYAANAAVHTPLSSYNTSNRLREQQTETRVSVSYMLDSSYNEDSSPVA